MSFIQQTRFLRDTRKLSTFKCISPYLAAAPSSERLTLLGASIARLVRTPQAEKHISVLLESSSVTTNWCTEEGERRRREGADKDKAGQR